MPNARSAVFTLPGATITSTNTKTTPTPLARRAERASSIAAMAARAAAPSPSSPLLVMDRERLGGCHTALQAVFLYRDHLAENGIIRRPIMSPYGTALGVPASALWETRGGRRLPVASSSRLAHSIPPGQRRV